MKELSIEEKAKRYDEAVVMAKECITHIPDEAVNKYMLNMFPELKESEDERIRKSLIDYLRERKSCESYGQYVLRYDHWIAWLEKQREQKSVDNVEPKFKVGDFIANDYCIGKVVELTNDAYLLDTGQGIPFSCEHNTHLWSIKDAKDGDVLTWDGSKCIALFKNIYDGDSFNSYGLVGHCTGIFEPRIGCHSIEGAHPATKEQRDLLFQKMEQEGYEWDAEQKRLKNIEDEPENYKKQLMSEITDLAKDYIQQKPIWSEEDERMVHTIIADFKGFKHDNTSCLAPHFDECIAWLNSLKERYTWKPTKEQINAIRLARSFVTDDFTDNPTLSEILLELEKQLKKIMEG